MRESCGSPLRERSLLAGLLLLLVLVLLLAISVGTIELAALGFSVNFVHIPGVAGFGFLSALSVLVAQTYGAGRKSDCSEVLRHGVVLMALLGLAIVGIVLLLYRLGPSLGYFGQDPEVFRAAGVYIPFYACGFLFVYCGGSFKSFCEAQDFPWPPLLLLLGSVGLNIFLNWLLIFGNWGFPALGLQGAGIATALANFCSMSAMALLVLNAPRFAIRARSFFRSRLSPARFHRHLGLGGPTALQVFFEAGAFLISALLIGVISARDLAAHHVAIQMAAFSFMVPLGVSFAVSIRVGQALGRSDTPAIRRIAITSQMIVLSTALVAATLFVSFNDSLPRFFTDDPEVAAIAAGFLLVTALFQIFDQQQVGALGVLRGLGDVRIPTLITLGAYWCACLPLSWLLGFHTSLGALGIWIALTIGLCLAAIALNLRLVLITRRLSADRGPASASTNCASE